MTNKRLEDYTLGEVRQICKKVPLRSCKKECPFMQGANDCTCPFVKTTPNDWEFRRCLTSKERELLRLTGAKWVSRDPDGGEPMYVYLWEDRPHLVEVYGAYEACSRESGDVGRFPASMFPTIRPGECLCVEELLGEGDGNGD